ncbi:hypothetical protein J2S13_002548 [Oikeobacillus pervagus]|uniref:Uncharacterized protein n=1 Tax=Oikeobacillus pervagus TaxID=1325931 RepID=A0AAJ1T6L5_9BACI|nr:hypothetical protein [Oikeobacillus pervagus]MDQ0216126.1 hypothetical protein [Oikeobacillus pervagus]
MNPQEESNSKWKEEFRELKESIQRIEMDIQEIKKRRETITLVGQIGGIILGAIVLIGIFW